MANEAYAMKVPHIDLVRLQFLQRGHKILTEILGSVPQVVVP